MAKDLHTLIRLRGFEVDECRRSLGDLLRAEDVLIARQEALEAEYAREVEFARENPGFGQTLGAYIARHKEIKDKLLQQRQALAAAILVARDVLASAYKDLKTVELTQENRDLEARKERDRKEQVFLDELGQDRYRRRKGKAGLGAEAPSPSSRPAS